MTSGRRVLFAAIAIIASTAPASAQIDAISGDGWHTWRVTAVPDAPQICCFRWNRGTATQQQCDLDSGHGGFSMDDEAAGHDLQVYARMENGRLTKLRALSASCPVASAGAIDDLGTVATEASIDWLMSAMDSDEDLSTDIMAAIAFHAGSGSVPALASILEDRSLDRELRGEALFWLVQNGSDDALVYLDRILAAR